MNFFQQIYGLYKSNLIKLKWKVIFMYETLKKAIVDAMKEKDTLKVQTLRGVKGEIDLEHINKQNELNDIKSKYLGKEGVITLLQSKIKELKELKQKRDAEKATDINTITSSDNKEEEKPKEENKDK